MTNDTELLNDLNTINKESIVDAINEVKENTNNALEQVSYAVTRTEEVGAELRAFRIALAEGITANQFSDDLSSADGFIIHDGYFNAALGRIEG